MSFYDDMADMGAELLLPDADGGLGQGVVTLRQITTGPSAEPGEPGVETETLITVNATGTRVSQAFAKGTLVVERGDILNISPFGLNEAGEKVPVIISNGDQIIVDGDTRSLIDVKPTPAIGTVCLWTVKVAD